MRQFFKRMGSAYKACALLTFNTVVAYVALNLLLAGFFRIRDAVPQNPVSEKYGSALQQLYPEFDAATVAAILAENWQRPYIYADFTHFAERPFRGRFVNVSPAGFRHSAEQGPWPVADDHLNVFLFGGSTTFCYGLPDEQTLASRLQEALSADSAKRVCVYNFGVGWYYSTQERLRLEQLLFQGHVPDVAIFVDGLNDFFRGRDNRPAFSDQLARAFEKVQAFDTEQNPETFSRRSALSDLVIKRTPVARLAGSLSRRLVPPSAPPAEPVTPAAIDRACDVYCHSKALLEHTCRHFGVMPVFVWQPVPGYKYDLRYHQFVTPDRFRGQHDFYVRMARRVEDQQLGDNFLWCADIQQTAQECLYVDSFHYSARMTRLLARAIVEQGRERGIWQRITHVQDHNP